MKCFITGGYGFLGSNLAAAAIEQGYSVSIFDNLSRTGSRQNQEWLSRQGDFNAIHEDIRNRNSVEEAIKDIRPDIVFHLAGQVAMTTSIENPALDFDTNAVGTFNLLDGVRKWVPGATVVYSSTNKVYGDLEWIRYEETSFRYTCPDYPMGFDESIPLDFRSPYGCSKGCADQYMLDYARVFGLNTVVFRHSSMYGGRQFSTYDQGWVGWFCQQAVLQTKNNATPFSISGNGKQVRDLLHARDMIDLYFSAVRHIQTARGNVFNIGGTIAHSMSLLELFAWLENRLGVDLNYSVLEPRKSDQKVFVADVRKATELLGWAPKIDMNQGLSEMLEWVSETTI